MFFKIVVSETDETDWPDVLAFLIPQNGNGQFGSSTKSDLTPYLTSVDVIEALTGLNFLTVLDGDIEEQIERVIAVELWEVE